MEHLDGEGGGRTEAPATPRRAGVTCDSASAGGQSRRAARAVARRARAATRGRGPQLGPDTAHAHTVARARNARRLRALAAWAHAAARCDPERRASTARATSLRASAQAARVSVRPTMRPLTRRMAVQALHVQTGKTRGRARAQLRDGAAGHAARAEVALAPRGRRSSLTMDMGSSGEPPAPSPSTSRLRVATTFDTSSGGRGSIRTSSAILRAAARASSRRGSDDQRRRSFGAPSATVAGAARARSQIGLDRPPRTPGMRPECRRSRRGGERRPRSERLHASHCEGPSWYGSQALIWTSYTF